MIDEKQLWEEYDKWFFGKGISDYGTKMFGFMAAKWARSTAPAAEKEAIVSILNRAQYVHHEDLPPEAQKEAETRAAYGNTSALQDARDREQRRLIDEAIERLEAPASPTVGDSAGEPNSSLNLDEQRLALWNAIRAIKFGSPTDDKVLLDSLHKLGFVVSRASDPPAQTADVRAMTDGEIINRFYAHTVIDDEPLFTFDRKSALELARALLEHSK